MSDALARIEASRMRLRLAMLPPPPKAPGERPPRPESLFRRLTTLPLVEAVRDSLASWWRHHPLKPVAHIASQASNAVAKPIAQRNPWSLVLVASAIGAGLAWTRPWRWIFRSALFAGLVPQLAARVVSSLPIESWMSMAGATLSKQRAARAARAEAPTP